MLLLQCHPDPVDGALKLSQKKSFPKLFYQLFCHDNKKINKTSLGHLACVTCFLESGGSFSVGVSRLGAKEIRL